MNIFADIPEFLPEEVFQSLAGNGIVKIERILSDEQSSPEGFYYDQEWHEWVLILRGGAVLEIGDAQHTLEVGDYLMIPARARHRVVSTRPQTLWLAVHYTDGEPLP